MKAFHNIIKRRGARLIITGAALTIVGCFLVAFISGCKAFKSSSEGNDIKYDLCDETMIPVELQTIIDNKKENSFRLTYANNTYTYIVVCEGAQDRSDVEVEVEELYKDKNAVYVKTLLTTMSEASAADAESVGVTYPYTVIRIRKTDLPVVFK